DSMERWRLSMVLGLVTLAGCGGEPMSSEVGQTAGALTSGGQIICQDCQPYDAAFRLTPQGKTTFCSGAAIGSHRILTSAKCLTDVGFAQTVLLSNAIQCTNPGTARTVNQTFVHTSYDGTPNGSDAAVIEFTVGLPQTTLTPITPLPIDDEVYGEGWTFGDIAFGGCNPAPGVSGTKQYGDTCSQGSNARYIANIGPAQFCAGDWGGVLIHGANLIAGINSFSQVGNSFLTRTQPIRGWIMGPTRLVAPFGFRYIISKMTGKCLQANGGNAVTESF